LQSSPRGGVLPICSLPCTFSVCSTCYRTLLPPHSYPLNSSLTYIPPYFPSAIGGDVPTAVSLVHYCTPLPHVFSAARWAGSISPPAFCSYRSWVYLHAGGKAHILYTLSDLACRHGCVVALFALDYPFARFGVCSTLFCLIPFRCLHALV
jgi:hypothetical protein